jgi:hypothetical protein
MISFYSRSIISWLRNSLADSKDAESIRRELVCGRELFRLRLRDRLEETVAMAPLSPGTTSDDAASLIISLIQGLAE